MTPARPPPAPGTFAGFGRDIAGFAGRRLAGLGVLAVLAALAEGAGLLLIIPILTLAGIDNPASRGQNAWTGLLPLGLGGALALYVLLVTLAVLVVAGRNTAVARLRLGYVDDLRRRLHRALAAMEWRAFSRLSGAETSHVLLTDAIRAAQGVDFLLRLAGWAIELPVLLTVALRLSPAMTAIALGLAGACLILARPLNRRAHGLGRRLGEAGRALHADLTDDLAGMRVIRALGLEQRRNQRFEARMETLRRGQLNFQASSNLARAAMQSLAALAAALAVWIAVTRLGMALAETLVLMMAFARLLTACLRIQDAWRTVLHALPAHAATHELLARCLAAAELPAEPPPGTPAEVDGAPPPPLRHGLRLEGVGFHYRPEAPAALSGIAAEIPARRITALVGPSGSGKSTLADLLLGLIEPDAGRILADGRPLAGAGRRQWRQRVGYVPQDSFLFHDTIRANLLMALPETRAETGEPALWAALEQAAAADFVRALPAGLDTVVGDRGGLLSGGQRQRLALARALLPVPELLILDEATSALDQEHETRVLEALAALRGRLTLVVIAHRPSTVRCADRVLVLEAGRLAGAGDWAEVSAAAGPLLARLAML